RNRAHAIIKEFPTASLRKLVYIDIIYLKGGRFIVNIGRNPPIRTPAFSHLTKITHRGKKRRITALVALANYSHVS
ncbi:MAG: hypothetical protein WAN73_03805, partial [Methyloceanibacter sp.]